MRARLIGTWVAVGIATLAWTAEIQGQTVSLDFRNGGITLVARGVTLQEILREWSRVGGVDITVRGDGFSTAPIDLLLRDLTEREALDILLREVGGYLLVARQNPASGSSGFERIIIVPAKGDETLARASDTSRAPSPRVRPSSAPQEAVPSDFASELLADAPRTMSDAGARIRAGDDRPEVEAAAEIELAEAPADTRAETTASRSSASGRSGADTSPVTGPVPPTPLLPPTPVSKAGNPFGSAAGSAQPGAIVPAGGPPPGVVYPPVTNPNLERGFTPGTAPR